MSLSSQNNNGSNWGTIYSQGREHTLGGVEHGRSTAWTPDDEVAYLDRVRERAGQMATRLITEARREAENIRLAAREEGYRQGLEEAHAELEEFRAGMGEAVASVLGAIEGQCSSIFDQWREDLLAVSRLAVEKVTGLELSQNRQAVLDALLSEAVAVLEHRKELVIRVNPEDEPMLADIVGLARVRFPDVNSWRVKGDSSITPGGMVVESESSLAEGRVESRIAAVEQVLSRLVLADGLSPEGFEPAPQTAPPFAPGPEPAPEPATPPAETHPEGENPLPETSAPSVAGAETSLEPVPEPAPEAVQEHPQPSGQAGAEPSEPQTGEAEPLLAESPALPAALPGLDLADPKLSQEDIEAALEALMPSETEEPKSRT